MAAFAALLLALSFTTLQIRKPSLLTLWLVVVHQALNHLFTPHTGLGWILLLNQNYREYGTKKIFGKGN